MRPPLAVAIALALAVGTPAVAFRVQPAPNHSIWKPADTPPGGLAWSVLESTTTTQPADAKAFPRPVYPAAVRALRGKTVKVSGYMLPLQNGDQQTHFVLLAYPPDCPFHLNPGPQQFIEVRTTRPVKFDYGVKTIQGALQLLDGADGGIFYRMSDARPA